MFSNLYYLDYLIKNNKSLNFFKKQRIYKDISKNKIKVLKYIKILENEKNRLFYLQKEYDSKIYKIGEHLTNELLDSKKEEIENKKIEFKNKILFYKNEEKKNKIEEDDKIEKQLDLLFNK